MEPGHRQAADDTSVVFGCQARTRQAAGLPLNHNPRKRLGQLSPVPTNRGKFDTKGLAHPCRRRARVQDFSMPPDLICLELWRQPIEVSAAMRLGVQCPNKLHGPYVIDSE